MSMGLLRIVALITVINVRREEDAHAASLGGFEKEPFVFNRKHRGSQGPKNLNSFSCASEARIGGSTSDKFVLFHRM